MLALLNIPSVLALRLPHRPAPPAPFGFIVAAFMLVPASIPFGGGTWNPSWNASGVAPAIGKPKSGAGDDIAECGDLDLGEIRLCTCAVLKGVCRAVALNPYLVKLVCRFPTCIWR